MNVKLLIEVNYWNKESFNLYDYDAKYENYDKDLKISSNGFLVKSEKDVFYIKTINKSYIQNKNISILFSISFSRNNISLSIPMTSTENTYLSIKHTLNDHLKEYTQDKNNKEFIVNSNLGLNLHPGYILKLGKLTFEIIEVKPLTNQLKTNMDINDDIIKNIQIENKNHSNIFLLNKIPIEDQIDDQLILEQNKFGIGNNKKINSCRVCLSDDYDINNPLISPCKCSGTMKNIHFECLKNWLKSKIIIRKFEFMTNFSYKQLECELCKSGLPLNYKTKKGILEIIDYERPSDSYIIMDQINKDEKEEKVTIIVTFKQLKSLKVGRSNECDVRLFDISISRHHANLYNTKDGIFLEDNHSKFGSLLLFNQNFKFILYKDAGFQIGKHFFLMRMEKTFCSYFKCMK